MAVLAASAAVLAGCSVQHGSIALQVRSFAGTAQLGQSDQLLATDVAEVGRGIAEGKLLATHTACDGLATDAATALGMLPSPDQRLTDELNRAYLDLARAAQDCSEVARLGPGAFARYEAESGRAMASLHAAEARVRLLEAKGHRQGGAG